MESVTKLVRILQYIPKFWFHLIASLVSWFIPRSWYAKKVDQDVVLITGAGSGLGRDIALEYAKLKSSLVLWDINEAGLKETKALVEAVYAKVLKPEEESRDCSTYLVDVSNREKIYESAKQVKIDLNKRKTSEANSGAASGHQSTEAEPMTGDIQEERYVSVLVNNAGIYYGQYLHDLSDQQITKIFDINILAHFWTVRAFLPDMIKHKRGHILEIASMGGLGGMFKQVDYCATKFATVGFEESLSMELDHLGLGDQIKTTVVCPFFFGSNLFSNFDDKSASLMTSRFVAKEAVLTMRCNHSQVLLPRSTAYPLYFTRGFLPRRLVIEFSKISLSDGVKNIVGHGAKVALGEKDKGNVAAD